MGLSELRLLPLRDLLAERFPSETDIRRILDEIHVRATRLKLNEAPINSWHNTLLEIHRQNKMPDLFLLLIPDMPDSEELLQAIQKEYEIARVEIATAQPSTAKRERPRELFYFITNIIFSSALVLFLLWRLAEYTALLPFLEKTWFILAAIIGVIVYLPVQILAKVRPAVYKYIYSSILTNSKTTGVISILAFFLIGLFLAFRTVEVNILDSNYKNRQLRITRNNDLFTVPRNKDSFRYIFASLPLSEQQIVFHTSGLPKSTRNVPTFFKLTFDVPQDFWGRPIALLRPSSRIMILALNAKPLLRLRVQSQSGELLYQKPLSFDGRPIFLGCSNEVEIPKTVLEQWRQEAIEAGNKNFFEDYWMQPHFEAPTLILHESYKITVELLRRSSSNAPPIFSESFKVKEPNTVSCEPQIMIF